MVLTARQAEGMVCPFQSSSTAKVSCKSDGCPLWRWIEPGNTAKSTMPEGIKAGYCGAGGTPGIIKLEDF
jgi:hypothetical protein